jgi:hypothetical protein
MTAIAAHFRLFWYSQTPTFLRRQSGGLCRRSGFAKAHPYKCGFHSLRFTRFLLFCR